MVLLSRNWDAEVVEAALGEEQLAPQPRLPWFGICFGYYYPACCSPVRRRGHRKIHLIEMVNQVQMQLPKRLVARVVAPLQEPMQWYLRLVKSKSLRIRAGWRLQDLALQILHLSAVPQLL